MTDLEIAHNTTLRPIEDVAGQIGIPAEKLEHYILPNCPLIFLGSRKAN